MSDTGRCRPSPETLEKTEVLLSFIKDAFQAFSYKEGIDQSKAMTWAEALAPVIDWTIEGVLDYIHDNRLERRKDSPSLADIYDYSLKAKNRAEEPNRVNENTYIPPAEQQEIRGHDALCRELFENWLKEGRIKQMPDFVLTDDELQEAERKKLSAPNREERHKRQREAAERLAKNDLPFTPDEDQIEQFESDSEV